ncbi:MAG: energy transducer TonB [Sphingobacteriaceae bacterium]|nr:energy transducer TonB [Sphingobacteriaceae bacterium]
MNRILILVALSLFFKLNSQVKVELNPDPAPINIGGKKQLDHIIYTQLIVPPKLIWVDDKLVTIYFTVTKEGKAIDPFFKDKYDEYYQTESKRILNFLLFEPGKVGGVNVDAYGSITMVFNGEKYKESLKERKKLKSSLTKPQDSTFVVYETADKSPEYYKGEEAFTSFLLENIEYPNVAKTQNIEGTVQVSFIIETNGFVSNIKIIKGVNGGCSEEAVRVVQLLKWKPAEKNGKYVRYKVTYPITFSLKNINKDNSNGQQ